MGAAAAAAAAAGSAPVGASTVGLAALAAPSSPDASPPCPPWQRSIRQNSRRPEDERWGRAKAIAHQSGGGRFRAARPLLLGRHLRRQRSRVRPLRSRLRARRRRSLRVLLLALYVVLVLRHHVRPPHRHLPMRAARSDRDRGCGPSEGGGAHLGLELGRERLGLQLDQIRHLCASRAGVSVGRLGARRAAPRGRPWRSPRRARGPVWAGGAR